MKILAMYGYLRDKELMNKLFYKGEAPWLK